MLEAIMAPLGIEFIMGDEVETFTEDALLSNTVSGARLKSGRALKFQLAIVATGITPNAELGDAIGLKGSKAILVDDYMRTADPNISAIGECIEHNKQTFGLVDPLWRHAQTLAQRLAKDTFEAFENAATATKLKVSGVQLFSAGVISADKNQREIIISDPSKRTYRKLVLEHGLIVGIVLFGDVSSGAYYFNLMENNISVDTVLPELIIGQEFAQIETIETDSFNAIKSQ